MESAGAHVLRADAVADLLRDGARPGARGARGRVPLHTLVRCRLKDGRLLVAASSAEALAARDEGGETPLAAAAGHGDTLTLASLLSMTAHGALPLEVPDNHGRTPLLLAAAACARDQVGAKDEAARLFAAGYGVRRVEMLLAAGCDPRARCRRGAGLFAYLTGEAENDEGSAVPRAMSMLLAAYVGGREGPSRHLIDGVTGEDVKYLRPRLRRAGLPFPVGFDRLVWLLSGEAEAARALLASAAPGARIGRA